MSNNIAVITHDEFAPKFLPNPNLTMAIPSLATLHPNDPFWKAGSTFP
jgi:hypothetical protein